MAPLPRLFFFQAEDGIRDTSVTGVQTCALPILDAICRRAAQPVRVGPYAWLAWVPPSGLVVIAENIRAQVKIGRASCRERVEISVGAGSLRRKAQSKEVERPATVK